MTLVDDASTLPAMALSELERAVLDFERSWWLQPGRKDDAIRSQLGLSGTRYYQLLGGLVWSPEADRYDPLVVRRLRKLQARRRRARIEGRPAGEPPAR